MKRALGTQSFWLPKHRTPRTAPSIPVLSSRVGLPAVTRDGSRGGVTRSFLPIPLTPRVAFPNVAPVDGCRKVAVSGLLIGKVSRPCPTGPAGQQSAGERVSNHGSSNSAATDDFRKWSSR